MAQAKETESTEYSSKGASVPDKEALGHDSESVQDWQKKNGIDTSKQIKLVKLAHMRYQHPDLDQITVFMKDFGMQVATSKEDKVWFRGYGSDQYVYYAQKGPKKFLGGTFEVESYEELAKAAKLEGAGSIQSLDDAPGGGSMVSLVDPEGFPINLMHGQEKAEVGTLPEKLILNYELDTPRVREFQRFTAGPAAVHKLGHYGLCVQNFERQVRWYTHNFNLIPTDFLQVPDQGAQKKMVGIFARIDRGQDYVDHHTFFMTANKTSHVHHCSFEVHDYDTQHLGHNWLAKKGYKSAWGVGRHILGSQIFDYWWDTTGNMIEHYADGDRVNRDTLVGYQAAGDDSLAVWGPEVPQSFLE